MSEIEFRCDVSVNELSMSLHVTEIDEVGVTRPSDIHFASPISFGQSHQVCCVAIEHKVEIKLAKSLSKSTALTM